MSVFVCMICDYSTTICCNYKKHLLTKSHIDKMCTLPKDSDLICPKCNVYVTKRKDHFRVHLVTCDGIKSDTIECKLCHASFKTRSGLHKHASKCVKTQQPETTSAVVIEKLDNMHSTFKEEILAEIKNVVQTPTIEEIISELKNVIKEMPPTTIDNRQDHRQFNLNVFLNEKCKDAMNIMDFARTIQLTYANLDKLLDKGYVDGLSDIIGTGLRNLALTERPMHCSDSKRNVLHVKHEGEWQHNEEAMPLALQAVELIRQRHLVLLKSWQNETPDARKPDSSAFEHFLDIMKRINGNGARLVDDATFKKRTDKIVTRLSKDVKIDKRQLEI